MAELKTILFTDIVRSVDLKGEMPGHSDTERDRSSSDAELRTSVCGSAVRVQNRIPDMYARGKLRRSHLSALSCQIKSFILAELNFEATAQVVADENVSFPTMCARSTPTFHRACAP